MSGSLRHIFDSSVGPKKNVSNKQRKNLAKVHVKIT